MVERPEYVHHHRRYHLIVAVAAAVVAIAVLVLVLWLVFAKQDSKLYEADNVVCVSQPFALQCFERKPR